MKHCIDCKWCSYKPPTFWQKIFFMYVPSAEFSKCLHPMAMTDRWNESREKTLVDGKDRRETTYCSIMRSGHFGADKCGPEGKLFEPKE